jgi:hypothetical protein
MVFGSKLKLTRRDLSCSSASGPRHHSFSGVKTRDEHLNMANKITFTLGAEHHWSNQRSRITRHSMLLTLLSYPVSSWATSRLYINSRDIVGKIINSAHLSNY